ncbi:hypothetical protein AB836_00115 [Rickettsiales bacterium (ex Bugula neritina AB1)]|nr:hypothetical protein AB836_00115 [Rickettsiales bacterium (ex Bugula neritina AB1)]
MSLKNNNCGTDLNPSHKEYLLKIKEIIIDLLGSCEDLNIYSNILDVLEGNDIFFFEIVTEKFQIKLQDKNIENIKTFLDLYNVIYCF